MEKLDIDNRLKSIITIHKWAQQRKYIDFFNLSGAYRSCLKRCRPGTNQVAYDPPNLVHNSPAHGPNRSSVCICLALSCVFRPVR